MKVSDKKRYRIKFNQVAYVTAVTNLSNKESGEKNQFSNTRATFSSLFIFCIFFM